MKNMIKYSVIILAALLWSRCNLEKINDSLVAGGPTASFTVDKTSGEAPVTITLTNQSVGGSTYLWNFGNSTTSALENPGTVTYNTPNTYTITLIVTDNTGLKDTFTLQVTVVPPAIKFEKNPLNFGPGSKAKQLSDGGYIIVGTQNNDAYLVRTDANGEIISQGIYSDSNADIANDVIQLSDGTFVVVGSTFNAAANNNDIYYLRVNSALNSITGPTRFGTTDAHDEALHVMELSDGSVLISGYSTVVATGSTDVYIARYSPNLSNLFFKKNIPGPNAEVGFDAVQVTDGYVITGEVSYPGSATSSDALFLKIDENGNTIGSIKAVGDNSYEQARSIAKINSSELMLCGTIVANGASESNIYLQKTDNNGNKSGPAIIIGGIQSETAYDITSLTGGGFAVAGQSGLDAYLVTTNEDGVVQINKPFVVNGEEAFLSIQQTADGGFILCGFKSNALYYVKTDANGNVN